MSSISFSKRIFISFLCFWVTLLFAKNSMSNTQDDASYILSQSDLVRIPQNSFIVDVSMIEYIAGKQANRSNVVVYSRKNLDNQFLSIVQIVAPAVDKGKLMLRNGNNLWMFDPKSKASVRLSARQRLLGNASNGDVITSNFTSDYSSVIEGEEIVENGDKENRLAWKLTLMASNSYAPYHSITYWIDKENYRPVKAMFYGSSGKLLKASWYRNWQDVLGYIRPTEIVIVDGFNNRKVTVINMDNYRLQELPLSWFNKAWLAEFTSNKGQL